MNILREKYEIWRLSRKFSDYRPSLVSYASINRWLSQYEKGDHELLIKLLKKVIYFSEVEIESVLQKKNKELLDRLAADNLPINKVIYVTIDETASSSHDMLSKLKRVPGLERSGCKFIDSRAILDFNKLVSEIGSGAIIYIDDFAGTGNQLCESRDYVAQNIQVISSNFSEFFLAPCICEEAIPELEKRGIVPVVGLIHSYSQRVLHPQNEDGYFTKEEKTRLVVLSKKISRREPLGYKNLATMIALYRNAPNTTPLVLRGNIGQNKFIGVLPRTTDLLVPSLVRS